jgi:predicted nucleic acid-binding protein
MTEEIENMTKEIENLIKKSAHRDIQLEMIKRELDGFIITKQVVFEIIKELEDKQNE